MYLFLKFLLILAHDSIIFIRRKLLDFLNRSLFSRKVEDKSSVDVGVLSSKLMSFAMSFGRMGLDFRPLIANVLNDFVVSRFSSRVSDASSK